MNRPKRRALSARSIKCDQTGKCPRHEKGYRYLGTNKCWGCDSAFWWDTGKPYGRRKMKPKVVDDHE